MPSSTVIPASSEFSCDHCPFTGDDDRTLRSHKRTFCTRSGLVSAHGKVKQDVLVSSSSSAHVHQDIKTPPGNIEPDLHHSVDAKTDCRCTIHGVAKIPPTSLSERRPHLKLPSTPEEWKKINEELKEALPQVYPKAKLRSMTCSEAESRFEAYLYDFIAQRVPQDSEEEECSIVQD